MRVKIRKCSEKTHCPRVVPILEACITSLNILWIIVAFFKEAIALVVLDHLKKGALNSNIDQHQEVSNHTGDHEQRTLFLEWLIISLFHNEEDNNRAHYQHYDRNNDENYLCIFSIVFCPFILI